jgi:hypothetical protein
MAGDFEEPAPTPTEQRREIQHFREEIKNIRAHIERITEEEWFSNKFASHRWNKLVYCGNTLHDAEDALESILRSMQSMDRA